MRKYKCIIFDVGYTLIDHNDEKETKMLSEILKIPYCEEFVKEVGNFWQNASKYTNNTVITVDNYLKIIDKNFPYLKKNNITPTKFLDALCKKQEVGKYDEVDYILNYLHKSYELDAITDWFTNDQKRELIDMNIIDFFDNVYGWDNDYAKPNPSRLIKNILNRYDKSEVLIVGNSLEADILCGINAGIDTVWCNRTKIHNKTNIKPTHEISNLKELKKII